MATATETRFAGFRPEAIQFLVDLAEHNDRAWFQPRKADYERLLKQPLEALVEALARRFAARGVPLRADPARSPFRIYRDVRFAKDKSPYKTNIGASFDWIGDGGDESDDRSERHGAGGYFHFQPGEMFVGGGMWHPAPTRLAAWRRLVATDPRRIHYAIDDPRFVATFGTVSGDRLSRVPQGFPKDHPEAELLKLKDVTFGRSLSDDEALSPDLPDVVADILAEGVSVFRLLASLPE